MNVQEIVMDLLGRYDDLVIHNTYGEIAIMLNPNNQLAKGKYFSTIKGYDGPNDKSSNLNRDTKTFRLNLKISKQRFLEIFNQSKLPERPSKGGVVCLEGSAFDFSQEDKILPHPVYGWMSWVSIVNPTQETFDYLLSQGFFDDAYSHAKSLLN
ncbi:DUF6194 family protein [Francisella hispaniensis]|uniref:DUF6194 domain-containing protein n=1 Tax=Francisella hispaniensis TaxID=622488 RepID=F4BJY5_9GAMM|nr:DUF6194 family protein [Francisella hispaniensis]AEB28479.1 hypothetical protein FN3523_0622 [Francisella hispaniensis]